VDKDYLYEVTLNVATTLHTTVKAKNAEEAKVLATREAYEDTWGCKAIWSHAEVEDYEIKEDSND
jgi:hypothetical protein